MSLQIWTQIRKQIVIGVRYFLLSFSGFTLGFQSVELVRISGISPTTLVSFFILFFSFVLTTQGIFTLFWMLYAWEDPQYSKKHQSPDIHSLPTLSFTALIPALHEEKVIKDTINAVASINYPVHLKEVLVLIRNDDVSTISKAQEAIDDLPNQNIRIITFDSLPINKPHTLNQGLREATSDIVAVFDAEDEPNSQIYKIINTVMTNEQIDVIQSGVQLMNYRSHWYSIFNVAEYFFWYKSGLHFFRRAGNVTPLGGNTVFFKRDLLLKVNGWNDSCLTEDADIGFRLLKKGAKFRIIYDERHVTKEETPVNMQGLIMQRTRWHQGFLQILLSNIWSTLPTLRQKLFAYYILTSPFLQLVLVLFMPLTLFIALTQNLPVIVSMISFLPLYIFGLQIATTTVGLYEFTRAYRLPFPFWMPLKVCLLFLPYQLLLFASSIRAVSNYVLGKTGWEKTKHINAHRAISQLAPNLKGKYVT